MKFVGPEWLWKYQQDVIVINRNCQFIMSGTPTHNTPQSSLRKSHSSQKQKSVTIVDNVVRTRNISTQTVHTKSATTQTKLFKKPLRKLKGNEDVKVPKKRGRPRKSDVQPKASPSVTEVNIPQKKRRQRPGLVDDDSKTIGERIRKRTAELTDMLMEKKKRRNGSALEAKLKEFLDMHPIGQASDWNLASSSSTFDAGEQLLRDIESQKCQIVVNCAPARRRGRRRLYLRNPPPEVITISDEQEVVTIEGSAEGEEAESSGNEKSAVESALYDLVESVIAQESTAAESNRDEEAIENEQSLCESPEGTESLYETAADKSFSNGRVVEDSALMPSENDVNNDITEPDADQQPAAEDALEVALENSSTTDENSKESETPEVLAPSNTSNDVEMEELNEQRTEAEYTAPEPQAESMEIQESASDETNATSPAQEESEACHSRSNSSVDFENTPVENEAESLDHNKFDDVLTTPPPLDFDEHQNFLESDEE
ncbi:unnamed protein product [Bursaphelenchus xylophilus]|uniref:(pine wood nematode) hypothetical protein n=1 Tax=Bursaphelenchus xylophilus TaxID=6326 RepID=A0A1I7SVG7_BURXY|nr:unnamed protein product [Bursaphelenchus xylophilus]CAG9101430.1 unnamed protein product [Bursaphelenchus xylophilus]